MYNMILYSVSIPMNAKEYLDSVTVPSKYLIVIFDYVELNVKIVVKYIKSGIYPFFFE